MPFVSTVLKPNSVVFSSITSPLINRDESKVYNFGEEGDQGETEREERDKELYFVSTSIITLSLSKTEYLIEYSLSLSISYSTLREERVGEETKTSFI